MSEISRDMDASADTNIGPDLFQYYIRVVAELLSRDDFPPSSSMTSGAAHGIFREKEDNTYNEGKSPVCCDSFFRNAVGHGLSDFRKARLIAMLRQSVVALTQEVNEMLDPVLSMHRLRAAMASTKSCRSYQDASSKDETENCAQKRRRIQSSLSSINSPLNVTFAGYSLVEEEVNDDLQVLLVNRGPKVEEKMEKYSAELSAMLRRMEEKLEELLDLVISSCRPMTSAEKHQLRRLIQKLPPKNLDRVAEIVQRGKPCEKRTSDDITVDLEHEDDLTHWRIYFYVVAVENARKLKV